MAKEDTEKSTKCWINDCVDNNVKVRDNYHITGKYRGSVHRDYNINLKSNHKNPVAFHNLKNNDLYFICVNQANSALKQMSYQMDQKNMSFAINNKFY